MSRRIVSQKFMRRFTGMTKYSRWVAWLVICTYLAMVFAAIAVGHYLVATPLTWVSAGLMALTSFFIGTRLRGLNNIVHECTHSTFSAHRGDNAVLGRICASLLSGCFKEYKDDHLSHHAHLGNYEQDRELAVIEKFRLQDPLTRGTIFRLFATPLLGLHLKSYSGVNLSGADGRVYSALKIALLLTITIFTVFNPMTSVLFVLFPLFFIFPTLNFWTDCLDHAGLVGADDELQASRNLLAPLPLRLLFFPRNDCYHLVHHLFPQIPARHLQVAHQELCQDSAYGSAPTAVRTVQSFEKGIRTTIS